MSDQASTPVLERRVRRAALVAAEEWTRTAESERAGRLSDHVVDAVFDTMTAMSAEEVASLLSSDDPTGGRA